MGLVRPHLRDLLCVAAGDFRRRPRARDRRHGAGCCDGDDRSGRAFHFFRYIVFRDRLCRLCRLRSGFGADRDRGDLRYPLDLLLRDRRRGDRAVRLLRLQHLGRAGKHHRPAAGGFQPATCRGRRHHRRLRLLAGRGPQRPAAGKIRSRRRSDRSSSRARTEAAARTFPSVPQTSSRKSASRAASAASCP